VFALEDPRAIARSLKDSAERSRRRKSDPYRSAMSMLNFYINRAGTQLPAQQRVRLEAAKDELRVLFGRPRQRREAIKIRRRGKRAALRAEEARVQAKLAARLEAARLKGHVLVNPANLAPTNSYSTPDFIVRGYYVDRPFNCKDCGRAEIWSATQQKWWYESAKGDVWTVAVRCRPCRRRERERRNAARRVDLDGLARKRQRA
jgi:hypothetical protein